MQQDTRLPRREDGKDVSPALCLFISFICPMLVLTLCYSMAGISPFGDTLLLCSYNADWPEQLERLRGVLLGGDSLFYSLDGGLGGDFYSTFASGLSNPFWLISVAYDPGAAVRSLAVINIIQSGFAGLFCCVMLGLLCGKRSMVSAAFATAYAAGSLFTLGFIAPELTGAAVFLPLVSAGVALLSERGSIISLIGSMVLFLACAWQLWPCLFIFVCVFFAWCRLIHKDKQHTLSRVGMLLMCIALSFGSAAVIIVPSLAVRSGLGTAIAPAAQIDHANFFAILAALFPGGFTQSGGTILLFCSTATILMLPIYFFNSHVGLGERQVAFFFLTGMLLCAAVPALGRLWLGFSTPNGITVGFGFVIVTMSVAAASRALTLGSVKVGKVLLGWGIAAALMLPALLFGNSGFNAESVIFAAAFLTLHAAVTLIALSGGRMGRGFATIMLLCICCECIMGGILSLSAVQSRLELKSYEDYSAEFADKNTLSGVISMQENPSGALYRVRGSSLEGQYCVDSPTNSTISSGELLAMLGISGESGYTFVSDSLLGIRYVTATQSSDAYELVGNTERTILYSNPYAIGCVYAASVDASYVTAYSSNPFAAQNELMTALAGVERNLFIDVPMVGVAGDGASVNTTLNGTEVIKSREDGSVAFTITCPSDGAMYMYMRTTPHKELISVNGGQAFEAQLGTAVRLGSFSRGDSISVAISISDERLVFSEAYFALLDQPLANAAFLQLAVNNAVDVHVDGSTIRCVAACSGGQMLGTTIPFQAGWHIAIDGIEVPTVRVGGVFLGAAMPEGTHAVELWYEPLDFTFSVIISLVSLTVAMVFIFLIETRRRQLEHAARKQHAPKQQPAPEQHAVQPDYSSPYDFMPEEYEEYDDYDEDSLSNLMRSDEDEPDEYGYIN